MPPALKVGGYYIGTDTEAHDAWGNWLAKLSGDSTPPDGTTETPSDFPGKTALDLAGHTTYDAVNSVKDTLTSIAGITSALETQIIHELNGFFGKTLPSWFPGKSSLNSAGHTTFEQVNVVRATLTSISGITTELSVLIIHELDGYFGTLLANSFPGRSILGSSGYVTYEQVDAIRLTLTAISGITFSLSLYIISALDEFLGS